MPRPLPPAAPTRPCSVDCHGSHYADASGKCQRCMPGCDDCKSADKCDACSEGFHRTGNGTCVPCTDKVGAAAAAAAGPERVQLGGAMRSQTVCGCREGRSVKPAGPCQVSCLTAQPPCPAGLRQLPGHAGRVRELQQQRLLAAGRQVPDLVRGRRRPGELHGGAGAAAALLAADVAWRSAPVACAPCLPPPALPAAAAATPPATCSPPCPLQHGPQVCHLLRRSQRVHLVHRPWLWSR